ncbi:MAG TPA: hypothetical protein VMJ10_25655 [Kofleriaceae bacterium]|nr:hypothetical protein [Kofleriaceae bacterium]
MRLGVVTLCLATACGRLGFDPFASGGGGGGDATLPPDSPTPCSTASQQLGIDAAGIMQGLQWVETLFVVPTTGGFDAVYIAPDNSLIGAQYNGQAGSYTLAGPDVTVSGSNTVTTAAGGIEVGGNLLLASNSFTTGMTLMFEVNAALGSVAGSSNLAVNATTRPIATSGDGSTQALLWGGGTAALSAVLVNNRGAMTSAATTIAPAAQGATGAAIAPAAQGFVATWIDNQANPAIVHAEVLDSALAVTVPDTAISASDTIAFQPDVGWASTAGKYLFAWSQNNEVWAQLTDATLQLVGAPVQLGTGTVPRVASDGTSFWVVWDDPSSTSQLSAAIVNATNNPGHTAVKPVLGTGGTVIAWDLRTVGGSPILVWYERFPSTTGCGGTSPPAACYSPLWAVPSCQL